MKPLVAIDGPGGSGKSTVSRAVARRLDLEVLDTGAMYRAVTVAVLNAGVDVDDAAAVADVVRRAAVEIDSEVTLDGDDVTAEIRGPEVTAAVSAVSAHPDVREVMVARQRAWVEERSGGVVEGRDIGTVVLPEATVKVFLTAEEGVRALRRQGDERASAREVDAEAVRKDLERRDRFDSERATAPLRPAPDATVIDTSELTVEDVVDTIIELVEEAGVGA